MKSNFTIIMLVLVMQVISSGQEISYDPSDWPRRTLKLSPEGTLRDVFDGGITPFRIPGSERSELRFKHANLIIETPEGQLLPELIVEYADIQVKPSGLWKLVVYSPGLSLEESSHQMTSWLPLIGKTKNELDKFLQIVEEDFLNYNDRDFGKAPNGFIGGWENQAGVTLVFG